MAFQTPSQASISPLTKKKKRRPLTGAEFKRLSAAGRDVNDGRPHLLAMLLDTGVRVSEAAGLHMSDIHLEHEFPYVEVRPDKGENSRLQTANASSRWLVIRYGPLNKLQPNNRATTFQDTQGTVIAMAIQLVRLWVSGLRTTAKVAQQCMGFVMP